MIFIFIQMFIQPANMEPELKSEVMASGLRKLVVVLYYNETQHTIKWVSPPIVGQKSSEIRDGSEIKILIFLGSACRYN